MPVKIGIPSGFAGGLVTEVENPMYSTCIGLVLHGARNILCTVREPGPPGPGAGPLGAVVGAIKKFFNEL
jgi:cell division ATPase FtsA